MIWFSLIFLKFLSLPVLNYLFRIGLNMCYVDGLERLSNAIFGINHRWPDSWLASRKREAVCQ